MTTTIVPEEFAHFVTDWRFSPGIEAGGFVFFSGITGARSDLSVAVDPEQQFREAFEFLDVYLTKAGLTFKDIVEITTYHVDLRKHINVFMKVKDEFIVEPYPAWSVIGISELITEGTLVEIRVIAYRSVSD